MTTEFTIEVRGLDHHMGNAKELVRELPDRHEPNKVHERVLPAELRLTCMGTTGVY